MGKLNLILTATDSGYTATLKMAGHEIDLLNAKAIAMQATMNGLRMYFMTSGAALAAMVAPGLLVSKMLGDYDLIVRRIMAAGGSEFAGHFSDVTDKISEMASTFGIAKEELATGLLELAKAGFMYEDIMGGTLEAISMMAVANATDFAVAAEVGTVAIQLWGDQIGSAERIMQIMHTTAIESLSDIEDYITIFEHAGASAVAAGIGFEEFMSIIGGLSQLAFSSGQMIGTFLNRLRGQGAEIERILNLSAGTIYKDGVVDLMKFNEVLRNTTSLTEEQKQAFSKLWGIRADKVLYAIIEAGEETHRIYQTILGDNDSLTEGFEEMRGSITYVWNQIMAVLTEPLISADSLDRITKSLADFRDAIERGGLGDSLLTVVQTSLVFISEHGDELVGILSNALTTFGEFLPVIQQLAEQLLGLLDIITMMPKELIMILGSMFILNKILPFATLNTYMFSKGLIGMTAASEAGKTSINFLGYSVTATTTKFYLLNAAMMGGALVGFMAIIMAKDPMIKALGAITVAVSVLAMIFWNLAAAKNAFESGIAAPVSLALMAAAAVGTMATIGLMMNDMNKQARDQAEDVAGMAVGGYTRKEGWKYLHSNEYVIPEDRLGEALRGIFPALRGGAETAGLPISQSGDTYYDYKTVNVYDASEEDVERVLTERGG